MLFYDKVFLYCGYFNMNCGELFWWLWFRRYDVCVKGKWELGEMLGWK